MTKKILGRVGTDFWDHWKKSKRALIYIYFLAFCQSFHLSASILLLFMDLQTSFLQCEVSGSMHITYILVSKSIP